MTCYSVVINNPTDTDKEQIESARALGWRVVGQLEKGDNGTPHYQLCITAPVEWKQMKSHFKRANIQEAEDPEALEKYCTKKATRVLDLTNVKPKSKKREQYSSADFYNDVFQEIHEQFAEASDELVKNVSNLLTYDLAVNQLILQSGYDIAVRATRPDVRSAYRKYRYAMWSVWYNDNIGSEHKQDADDDEGEQQDAGGSVGEEHDDSEAEEGSEGQGTDEETEGSGEGSSEGTSGE